MDSNLNQLINTAIDEVTTKFINYPNIFLTEDDLRMHLCNKLLENFDKVELTRDEDHSISLHTEIRWYGEGNMRARSDIVLIDVSTLDVLKHNKFPSKGYSFNIPQVVLELKLRRPNRPSDNAFLNSIQDDINKLVKLKDMFYESQGQNQTQFWIIALDKKKHIENITTLLEIPDYINFVYVFKDTTAQHPV